MSFLKDAFRKSGAFKPIHDSATVRYYFGELKLANTTSYDRAIKKLISKLKRDCGHGDFNFNLISKQLVSFNGHIRNIQGRVAHPNRYKGLEANIQNEICYLSRPPFLTKKSGFECGEVILTQ